MDLMDYRRKIIANSPHLASASGAVASFSDGADLPLKSLNVGIEPVQDLHGYDSPWVGGWGKNLFSFGNISAKSIYRANVQQMGTDPNAFYLAGASGTTDNMQLLVNAWSYVCTWINYQTTAETTITVSCKVKNYSADCNGYMRIRYGDTQNRADSTSAAVTNFNDVGQYQVTVTATIPSGKYVGLEFSPASKGSSFTLTQFTEITEFQLEVGSTATAYAPYENICPISGWDGVKVTRIGKNRVGPFADGTSESKGISVTYTNNLITFSGTSTGTNASSPNKYFYHNGERSPFLLKAGVTYTASLHGRVSFTNKLRLIFTYESQTRLYYDSYDGVWTFTPDADVLITQACLRLPTTGSTADISAYFQLEIGSEATEYEPYNRVNVISNGKNLLHITRTSTTVSGVTFTVNSDGTIGVNGTATANTDFSLYSSASDGGMTGSYILSSDVINSSNTYKLVGRVTNTSTSERRYINTKDGEMLIATGENEIIDSIYINVQSGTTVNNVVFKPMLRLSSVSDSTYEPYQTFYGGTLNPLTGVMTVDRRWWELKANISEWSKSTSYPGGFYTGGANYVWNWQQVKPNTPFICSHTKTAKTLSEYKKGTCFMDSSINIRIMPDNATLQDWVDYLTAQKNAGTPVQVCCYLRNPVTIQLTPQQIRTLYGDNTIFADAGNVALEYWAHQ